MKFKQVIGLFIGVMQIAFMSHVFAAPIQYQVSGQIIGENYYGLITPTGDPLATGTPFSATFFYDASTPITSAYYVAFGALSDLEGTVGNYHFSSSTGDVSFSPGATGMQVSFRKDAPFQSNGFVGFNANESILYGFGMYFGDSVTDQLPVALTTPRSVSFRLMDSDFQIQVIAATYTLNQVPVPPAAFLFGSAFLGFFGAARRRF